MNKYILFIAICIASVSAKSQSISPSQSYSGTNLTVSISGQGDQIGQYSSTYQYSSTLNSLFNLSNNVRFSQYSSTNSFYATIAWFNTYFGFYEAELELGIPEDQDFGLYEIELYDVNNNAWVVLPQSFEVLASVPVNSQSISPSQSYSGTNLTVSISGQGDQIGQYSSTYQYSSTLNSLFNLSNNVRFSQYSSTNSFYATIAWFNTYFGFYEAELELDIPEDQDFGLYEIELYDVNDNSWVMLPQSFVVLPPYLNPNTIWFDNFSNPSTWVIDHDAYACDLDWEIGVGLEATGSAAIATIASTTYDNGCAMIDSDFYGGEDGGSDVEDSWFTTANYIDLSANPNVVLEFETYYRKYNSETCFVVTSTNNTDWPELTPDYDASTNDNVYEVFPGIANNTSLSENPTLSKLNISASAGGEAQVWVRFHWTGTWGYSWFIDDVAIIEQPANDIELKNTWVSTIEGYEYGRTPAAHFKDVLVMGTEVFNFGTNNQTDVNIVMNISNSAGTSVLSESSTIASLNTDATDFSQAVMTDISLGEGVYEFSTVASSDGDNANGTNFDNNTYTKNFEVTENLFSIDGIGVYDNDMLTTSYIGTNYGNGTIVMARYELLVETDVVGLEIALHSATDVGGHVFPFLVTEETIGTDDMSSSNRIAENENGVMITQDHIDTGVMYIELSATTLSPGVYYACIELYTGPNEDDGVYILDDKTVAQPALVSMIYTDTNETVYTNGTAAAVRLAINDFIFHVYDCIDETACNYNPEATDENDTCIFAELNYDCDGNCLDSDEDGVCNIDEISGCQNELACNYNPLSTEQNGICVYPGENEFSDYIENYYDVTKIDFQGLDVFLSGTDLFSQSTNVYLEGSNIFTQGTNLLFYGVSEFLEIIVDEIYSVFENYESQSVFDCEGCLNDIDSNNICDEFQIGCPYPEFLEYDSTSLFFDYSLCITPIIYGCTDSLAYNYNSEATLDDETCEGCFDPLASNYSPLFNFGDNSLCQYLGCINPSAENYNESANLDDNSCVIYGCTFDIYTNYNSEATDEDGSCSLFSNEIYGCMETEALNYNIEASIDNGSCEYLDSCPVPLSWSVTLTGANMTVLIPSATEITINDMPVPHGSAIGAFFTNSQGELQCGGYTYFFGETTHISLMGDDSTTEEKDGFIDNETITWSIWDISSCVEQPTSVLFDEGINAFTSNGLIITESIGYSCQLINLPNTWYMFSSYIALENMDLTNVFGFLGNNLIIVKDNQGSTYLPEYNFNGIGDMQVGQGYQLKTTIAIDIELCGESIKPEQTPIPLLSGWNLIAYLRLNPSPTDQVMLDLSENGNLMIVKDYNGNPYLPEYNYNGLGDMSPGQGYQLNINEADTLNYLANNQEYRMLSNEVVNNKTNYYPELSPTGNNMHVVIPSHSWDILPTEGSEIAVYSNDGLLVGTSKYTSPTTVITIWGDDPTSVDKNGLTKDEEFRFTLLSDDIEKEIKIKRWEKGLGNYNIDAVDVIGSIETINFVDKTTLFDVIPNPSKTKTSISFYVSEKTKVNVSVYNILGKLISELTNSEYESGLHTLEMNVSSIEGGTYLYKMKTANFTGTKQMIIIK
ncbi:T9SS type A sorting domain-containing protein [bacterium]|nr:T9SS type A sorting domain-containing protein [bacterium]